MSINDGPASVAFVGTLQDGGLGGDDDVASPPRRHTCPKAVWDPPRLNASRPPKAQLYLLRHMQAHDEKKVTWLELLFDLIFVTIVGGLAHLQLNALDILLGSDPATKPLLCASAVTAAYGGNVAHSVNPAAPPSLATMALDRVGAVLQLGGMALGGAGGGGGGSQLQHPSVVASALHASASGAFAALAGGGGGGGNSTAAGHTPWDLSQEHTYLVVFVLIGLMSMYIWSLQTKYYAHFSGSEDLIGLGLTFFVMMQFSAIPLLLDDFTTYFSPNFATIVTVVLALESLRLARVMFHVPSVRRPFAGLLISYMINFVLALPPLSPNAVSIETALVLYCVILAVAMLQAFFFAQAEHVAAPASTHYLVERHGLIVLILFGEIIVQIVNASKFTLLLHDTTARIFGSTACGLVILALFYSYFNRVDASYLHTGFRQNLFRLTLIFNLFGLAAFAGTVTKFLSAWACANLQAGGSSATPLPPGLGVLALGTTVPRELKAALFLTLSIALAGIGILHTQASVYGSMRRGSFRLRNHLLYFSAWVIEIVALIVFPYLYTWSYVQITTALFVYALFRIGVSVVKTVVLHRKLEVQHNFQPGDFGSGGGGHEGHDDAHGAHHEGHGAHEEEHRGGGIGGAAGGGDHSTAAAAAAANDAHGGRPSHATAAAAAGADDEKDRGLFAASSADHL